jgi:Asp-tRNA(Asn)/Glu-tRNA(Gln) amidotransferase A subunit family amidase
MPVAQYTGGTLEPAIQTALTVWSSQPFAHESPEVTNEIATFFQEYDIILTPASPVFPPMAGSPYPKKDSLLQYNKMYYPFRLANCPQILLPVIRSPINGMAISLQIVGRPLSDSLVIQVAHWLQSLFGPQYPTPLVLQEGDVNAEQ